MIPKSGMTKPNLGFFHLSLMGYAAITVGVVILGLSVALKIQTSRLESCQGTVAQIKAVGEAEEAKRKKDKERADADHKRTIARLNADNKRLRNSAGRSVLPSAASAPGTCVSGPDTERALGEFVRNATEIIIECSKAVEDLDNAKRWAQGQ